MFNPAARWPAQVGGAFELYHWESTSIPRSRSRIGNCGDCAVMQPAKHLSFPTKDEIRYVSDRATCRNRKITSAKPIQYTSF